MSRVGAARRSAHSLGVMAHVQGFTFHGDELDLVPPDWPKKLPPRALFLGGASWAFSPGSSRTDTYKGWISRKAQRAYVWWRNPDFPEYYDVPAKYRPYASGPFGDSDRRALRDALGFGWSQEAARYDYELPMPSEMEVGFLNRVDFVLLCKEVWLAKRVEDDGGNDA